MIAGSVDPVTSQRRALQSAIAQHLATGHGWAWAILRDDVRGEYLKDAAALIDQGMTAVWENHDPGPNPPMHLEVEAAEFDRAMQWWMDFVSARHPQWGSSAAVTVSPEMDQLDPEDWDAWVSIAVTVSEEARRLYMRKFEQLHGVRAPAPERSVSVAPVSGPPQAAAVGRNRFAAAVGAVLAHRHGREWISQPSDVREAYLRDAQSLIDAGLTYW